MIHKGVSIALPIIASTAYVVELSFVPLILPELQADLGLNRSDLAWVFNAYVAAVAIGVLVGGHLGDRLGAQRVFAVGAVLFAIGSLSVALSDAHGPIVLGRVVQGFGGGLFSPVIPVLLARAAEGRPGRLLVLWGSISGCVAGVTPLAAHYLLGVFDWSLVFFGLAGLALPAVFIAFATQNRTRSEDNEEVSFWLALRQPLQVWLIYGYIFCNFGTIMLFIFLLPLTLDQAGYLPIQQAWVMMAFWVVFAISGVVLRNLADRRAIWIVLVASPMFVFVGFWVFNVAASPIWVVMAAACVGVAFACGNATSTTLVLRFCREGTVSLAASLDISIARLGAAAVVFLASPLALGTIVGIVGVLCLLTVFFAVVPAPLWDSRRTANAEN